MSRFQYDYILPVKGGKYNYIFKNPNQIILGFLFSIALISGYFIIKYNFKHLVKDMYDKNKCDPIAMILVELFDKNMSLTKAIRGCLKTETRALDEMKWNMSQIFAQMDELTQDSMDYIKKQYDQINIDVFNELKQWILDWSTRATYMITLLQSSIKGIKEVIDKIAASLVVFMYTCYSLMNIAIQSIHFVNIFLSFILIVACYYTIALIGVLIALAHAAYVAVITFALGVKFTVAAIILFVFLILLIVFIVIVGQSLVITSEINKIIKKENEEIEKFKRGGN